jgi:pyruvate dehydrogenase E2 component (dihydrolipoamide acetyltransferase)
MPVEVKLPQLAENLTEGEVLDVKVSAGDVVSQGQTLLEVEAEKSTAEVPSPVAGKVARLLVNKGDSVTVGQTICLVDETVPGTVRPATAQTDQGTTPRPELIGKKDETTVAEGPAAPEHDGRQKEADGSRIARPGGAPPAASGQPGRVVPAGPATRRLARELGIDLALVTGTGPGGRVGPEDVKDHVRRLASGGPTGRPVSDGTPELPDFERWGPVQRLTLDSIRRKTAQQMSLSWSEIPHVTHHDTTDVTDFEGFRKKREGKEAKITITALALKAVAIGLKEYPYFNTSLDLRSGQLILKRYYHVGVAVDTEHGLLVPVVRDVDGKTVLELAEELAGLAEQARQRKLRPEDMRGGTFTITNLGGIGGTGFTPIINFPEVAILGLARSQWQPVVRDGQVEPRLRLPLSLSYDHRVIDGAAAARFVRRIALLLENPWEMLMRA